MSTKLKYKHPIHSPEWTGLVWPYEGDKESIIEDVADNLAEDWAEEGDDEFDISIIRDDIEIVVLS